MFAWGFGVMFATQTAEDKYLEELRVFKNVIPRKPQEQTVSVVPRCAQLF